MLLPALPCLQDVPGQALSTAEVHPRCGYPRGSLDGPQSQSAVSFQRLFLLSEISLCTWETRLLSRCTLPPGRHPPVSTVREGTDLSSQPCFAAHTALRPSVTIDPASLHLGFYKLTRLVDISVSYKIVYKLFLVSGLSMRDLSSSLWTLKENAHSRAGAWARCSRNSCVPDDKVPRAQQRLREWSKSLLTDFNTSVTPFFWNVSPPTDDQTNQDFLTWVLFKVGPPYFLCKELLFGSADHSQPL